MRAFIVVQLVFVLNEHFSKVYSMLVDVRMEHTITSILAHVQVKIISIKFNDE